MTTALSDDAQLRVSLLRELAGHHARWYIRNGLADVLAWLGESVGPEYPPTHRDILNALGAP